MTLFASFTKDLIPAAPTRRTITDQLAPWRDAIKADRARGLDWKQLAEVCATKLKIKVSARSLERVVGAATGPSNGRKKRRQRTAKPSANASTTPPPRPA